MTVFHWIVLGGALFVLLGIFPKDRELRYLYRGFGFGVMLVAGYVNYFGC